MGLHEEYLEKLRLEKDRLNSKLRGLQTFEDLQEFLSDMNKQEYGFILVGKRRRYMAYSFTHMYTARKPDGKPYIFTGLKDYENRVHYLYGDGESVGKSYVKNLYKVLEVDD